MAQAQHPSLWHHSNRTMTGLDAHPLAPTSPWWKRLASKLLRFRFMVHDQWANVLFLHWRLPPRLEATLEENTTPFVVDRYDGSSWIGLILLTEENVGPAIGRSRWTCLTHHGINVRTYVRGSDESTRGIHFSSLECNDEFTAFGANFFGMPYKIAEIKRSYSPLTSSIEILSNDTSSSSKEHCSRYNTRSQRFIRGTPSILRILYNAVNTLVSQLFYSTKSIESDNSSSARDINSSSQHFTVDCSWSRTQASDGNDSNKTSKVFKEENSFCKWATERYFVYTEKYGQRWRGQVDHEPWPVEESTIQLENLQISGVESYEPRSMTPILRYMADHRPDHVGFSQGVGPVFFTMLQPV